MRSQTKIELLLMEILTKSGNLGKTNSIKFKHNLSIDPAAKTPCVTFFVVTEDSKL